MKSKKQVREDALFYSEIDRMMDAGYYDTIATICDTIPNRNIHNLKAIVRMLCNKARTRPRIFIGDGGLEHQIERIEEAINEGKAKEALNYKSSKQLKQH